MKKRITALFLAMVLAGAMAAAAGCGGSGTQEQTTSGQKEDAQGTNAPQTEGQQAEQQTAEQQAAGQEEGELSGTIRFAIYTDTARDLVAQKQAELYMEKHPGVTVEIVSVPFANYYTQLGQGLAAGSAWDVFMINGASFAELGKTGQLMDLTDEIAARGMDLNDYVIDPMNSSYEGRTYVLPYELNTSAILYNKDMFDAAGAEYPSPDWTWEDFREIAGKLTDPSRGEFGCYLRTAQPDLVSFVYQAGGALYSDDLKTITFSTPEVKKALTYTTELVTKYGYAPSPEQLPANISPFMTNKIGMASAMCFEVLAVEAAEFNWGIAPWPKDVNQGGSYWTQGMAVYDGTKNKELALDYIFFLAGEEAQNVMAEAGGAAPSLLSVACGDKYLDADAPDGMEYFVNEFIEGRAVAEPFTSKWSAISGAATSVVQTELSLVRTGDETLDDAIVKMEADAQKLLDEIQ